jgi:predicted kinase
MDLPHAGGPADGGVGHVVLQPAPDPPAAGKTTRARELAAMHQALRLTPDHWMTPLFGDPRADGKRWVLEGRLISPASHTARKRHRTRQSR